MTSPDAAERDNEVMDDLETDPLDEAVAELDALDPADTADPAAKLVEMLSALLDAEDEDDLA
ncbi:MAG TPA: hypothetical protein VID03_06750 [Acidimicrobiia bacterium]|jgi:hypothetical protein